MTAVLTRPPAGASRPAPATRTAGRPPHLDGADLLRAVGVVGVVAIHAAHWPTTADPDNGALWPAVRLATRFSVPAFVVLGALLLEYGRAGDHVRRFAVRRARRTLVPLVVWAPVYMAVDLAVLGYIQRNPADVAGWWAGGAGHLYYLALVPQLYLLYLLWPRSLRAQAWVAVLAMASQTALDVVRLQVPLDGLPRQLLLWHGYEEFPFWIGYFAVGVVAGRLLREGRVRPSGRLAAAGLLAIPPALTLLLAVRVATPATEDFASGTGAFLRPTLPPLVFAVCAAALGAVPALASPRGALMRAARPLSRHALGIYIVQALLLEPPGKAVLALLERPLPWSAIGYVLLVGAALLLSLAVTAALSRTRLAWTVGVPRRGAGPPPGARAAAPAG